MSSNIKKRFIINNIIILVEPEEWPKNSTFRNMYEGDTNSRSYSLNNNEIKIQNSF